jgi:hypothetical protein
LETWLDAVIAASPSVPAWTAHLQSFLVVPDDRKSMQSPAAFPVPRQSEEQSQSKKNAGLEAIKAEITVFNVATFGSQRVLLDIPAGVAAGHGKQVCIHLPKMVWL